MLDQPLSKLRPPLRVFLAGYRDRKLVWVMFIVRLNSSIIGGRTPFQRELSSSVQFRGKVVPALILAQAHMRAARKKTYTMPRAPQGACRAIPLLCSSPPSPSTPQHTKWLPCYKCIVLNVMYAG